MALQVNLTLSKTYFLPGEVVQVYVQICNEIENGRSCSDSQALHVKELSFQACGSEKTDPIFVHCLHLPNVPAVVTESRKRVRNIFSTECAVLVSDKVLEPHAVQDFQLRFRLPTVLPPSFRGSAVRFSYMIHVKAVYELHRGKHEAMVYETTASTNLMVWPNTQPSMQPSSANVDNHRTNSFDNSLRGWGLGISDTSALDPVRSEKFRNIGLANDKIEPRSMPCNDGDEGSLTAPTPKSVPLDAVTSSHAGRGNNSCEDGDMTICDYNLGRSCRIRWQELLMNNVNGIDSSRSNCSPYRAEVSTEPRNPTASAPFSRGVIPFGVNRPFDALPPLRHTFSVDTGSDLEDASPHRTSAQGFDCYALKTCPGSSVVVTPPYSPSHMQPQLSGRACGLSSFTRYISRRTSLFGKVYILNLGEQPLLRLLPHAPLEMPLQPGATFGGVLDFRTACSAAGLRTNYRSMTCYDVAILLETEEVISPHCRPQTRRLHALYLRIATSKLVVWSVFHHYFMQNKYDGERSSSGVPYVIRRLYGEHHEVACDGALTSFTFSLPSTATPSFRTPMVTLRWVLRFELAVGPCVDFSTTDSLGRPLRPQLEQLNWSLPLSVQPPAQFR
uniref:RGP1m n=1 Tax=Volvox carteri f. nagariensis TaxID=3068 RepID=D9CJ66_VOLCA|nr:RGP1m [Volvox carteri f. nagariensis]